MTFTGFQPAAIQFLADLAANNERAWFQPRKAEYERLLKEPLEGLCAALAERFAGAGVPLQADPHRSPFRIYRDVRFSKDKSPYKTHVAAGFPMTGAAGLGGYFSLGPGMILAGGGMHMPESTRLAAFRAAVAADPDRLRALLADAAFVDTFGSLAGDRLSRVPAGYPKDHPAADLLRLKEAVFSRRLSDAEAFSPELPDLLARTFAASVPLLRYLAESSAGAAT